MITEEQAAAIPHTIEDGRYIFLPFPGCSRDIIAPVTGLMVYHDDRCPYCGSEGSEEFTAGWVWTRCECGSEFAVGCGWDSDQPYDSVLLGVSKPSSECIVRAELSNNTDDLI